MAPRRRCPTCGSKQWHKEPSSGLIACSEGHILQNYRNETTEIEEMGPHAMKKRQLKTGRKKKGKQSHADAKLLHGAKGRYHYFVCLQLIFRKQVAALTRLWDLPPEFEVICRDLWALHLSLLPDPPPAEPYHHAHGNGDADGVHGDGDGDEPSKASRKGPKGDGGKGKGKDKGKEKDPGDSKGQSEGSSTSSSEGEEEEEDADLDREKGSGKDDDSNHERKDDESDTGDDDYDENEEDPELEALMRENSEISSSSDEEGDGMYYVVRSKRASKGSKGRHKYEGAMSSIVVLIVACWTLRVPVMYRDFTRLVESYELPYLDPVQFLPPSLVQHLTKHNIQALSPPHAPKTLSLHKLAGRFAKQLYSKYGVYTAELNAADVLWRITKEMGGTPMLYVLGKRVASVLSFPLILHPSLAPGLENAIRHQYDNAPPEVTLLASVMIVLKMVHGLDGKPRGPGDEEDVACALPRTKDLLRLLEELDDADAKRKEAIFDSSNKLHVGDMKEEELDEYISFCERVLLGEGARVVDGDAALDRYFCLAREDGGGRTEDDRGIARGSQIGGEVTSGGLRPGAEYKIWNGRDVYGTLPSEYKLVLERGARVVGVRAEYLGCVLEKYERRLILPFSLSSMRRFAKVFTAKKRDDKHVAAHTHSVASTASTPQPSIASDPAHSSASSSGSASVQTPDDDHHDHLGRADTKRSWKSWLAGKRTVSNTKQAPLPTQVRIEAPPVPDWHSHHLPSPFLHPAPTKPPPHPVPPDDSDEDESDHDHSEAHSFSPPASPAVPIHPPTPGRARDNLRLLTTNALTPPPPVSPFIQYTNGPVFPRSTNRSSLLPRQPSTRVNLLKKQLLSSLDTAVPSSPNMAAIMPFASRPSPSPAQPLPSSFPDIARPTSTIKIFSSSSGVRAWVARPCFEERNLIYLANQAGGIDVRPISSLFAIAALEYSEHLDVMADPDFLSSPAPPENGVFDAWSPTEPTIPATESHARTLEAAPTSAPAHSRNSYTSVPSPLRNEHTPSSPKETTPAAKPVRRSSVKRVVRFAEDDSDDGDDGVPLHIVRMKKMREQKAKFLRQEQLKRAKEEEEERRRKEQEALEVERKRVAAEKEKREKEKALYAEAVTAARMRAETTRAGGIPSLNATTSANLLGPSPSFTSLRDSERNRPPDSRRYSARSPHDSLPVPALPRREASDPVSPSSYCHYPSDSSPTSSRPPSIGHSPVSPHSRPPSTYSAHTSSSEDVRQQSGSRRNSTTAAVAAGAIGMGVGGMNGGMGMGIGMGVPSMYGLPPMIMSYPTWTGSNPNLQYVPPVPAFPDFVQDMPLLPPTAPFMKQPYERRSSRNSSPGPSLSPSSRRGSFNSSTERVNAMSGSPASMSRNSSGQRLSVSASPRKSDPTPTSSRPTHARRGSGDSRGSYTHHSAVPTSHSQHASNSSSRPPPPTTSRSQPVISRGRPPLPHPVKSSTMPLPQPKSVSPGSSQFLQAPSPWTALPSQTGRVPTAVPVSPYSHNLNSPPRSGGDGGSGTTGGSSGRRQTVIS